MNIHHTLNTRVDVFNQPLDILFLSLSLATSDSNTDSNDQNSIPTDATPLVCTRKAIDNSCDDTYDFMHDTFHGNTVSPQLSQITATTTLPAMQPTPLATSNLVDPPSPPTNREVAGPNREGETTTEAPVESGLTVTFNPLVIAFIVIGAFLFITLIILVFVLIFCLRRKRSPRVSKSRPRRLTDVESVGE